MTDSASDIEARHARTHPALCSLLLVATLLFGVGCSKKPPTVINDLLMPLSGPTRWGPEPSDLAAARLAKAALGNQPEHVEQALADVEAAQDSHTTKGLGPLCQDLANSTLDDPAAYRKASNKLKKDGDTDHALKARLDQTVKDDALRLAKRRRLDTWESLFARTFNAVSEPLGQALLTGLITAPFTLAQSSAHYLASFSNDEPLSVTHRQALVLHREYLAQNPDAEDAEKIQKQVDRAEKKLHKTHRKRRMRAAKKAQKSGNHRTAAMEARRALYHGEDEGAQKILDTSTDHIATIRQHRAVSLQANPATSRPIASEEARRLATALLASSGEPLRISDLQKLDIDPNGPLADEYAFARAIAQMETGWEDEGRKQIQEIASHKFDADPMARHSARLIENYRQDPYLAFKKLEKSQKWALVRYRFLADWTRSSRYPNLPPSIAYLIDLPSIAQTVASMPLRMVFGSWNQHPDFDQSTAVVAYRYLGAEPEGEHQREVLEWLADYEEKRGNAVAALRVADFLPYMPDERRNELLDKASEQALNSATNNKRADERHAILRKVAREFPDTESGHDAGNFARAEAIHSTAQQIRVTKSFLTENPRVAGPEGLGLNPELLNDDIEDGEIHPNGITFLGGRRIQLSLVGESGDEDDAAHDVIRTISRERLGRAAAMLDQTARQNQLIDQDETLANDGDRDQFLERAQLGLIDRPDDRASAQSSFVYRSMRERYGMVRGRESVLPFDLVFQGSFTDLSLGAFPRWRAPKETPDAFLYK